MTPIEKIKSFISALDVAVLGIDPISPRETSLSRTYNKIIYKSDGVTYKISTREIKNGELSVAIDSGERNPIAIIRVSDTDKAYTRFAVQCLIDDIPKTVTNLLK